LSSELPIAHDGEAGENREKQRAESKPRKRLRTAQQEEDLLGRIVSEWPRCEFRRPSAEPAERFGDKWRKERNEAPDDKAQRFVEAECEVRCGRGEAKVGRRHHGVEGNREKRRKHGDSREHRAPVAPVLQQEEEAETERPDRAEYRGVGKEAEQNPWPKALLRPRGAKRDETEAEQHGKRVVPADDEIFPEQEVTREQQELLDRPERREAPDQHPDPERDQQMQDLHRNRIAGEAGDHPHKQVPQPGMALISELGVEIGQRVAGPGHHEGLELVPPHRVAKEPDRVVDNEETEKQVGERKAERNGKALAPIGTQDARGRHVRVAHGWRLSLREAKRSIEHYPFQLLSACDRACTR